MKNLKKVVQGRNNPRFIGILLLLSFLLFTLLTFLNLLNGVDLLVTKFLQEFFPRFVDLPFSIFSLVGSAEMAILAILLLRLIYTKLNIIYVLSGFAFFHVIELIGKAFITHVGPSADLVRYYFHFSFPSSLVKPGYSYPSGHIGRTMFISTILILIVLYSNKLSKRNKYIFLFGILFFDLVMFISRIYLGEHWFSDVFAGVILGVSSALMFFAI